MNFADSDIEADAKLELTIWKATRLHQIKVSTSLQYNKALHVALESRLEPGEKPWKDRPLVVQIFHAGGSIDGRPISSFDPWWASPRVGVAVEGV